MNDKVHDIAAQIKGQHIRRRYAMKLQQKIDRAMESYVRINLTDWEPDLDEKARAKINKEVAAIIKAARDGEGDPEVVGMVLMTDASREPADGMRARAEKDMEALAEQLPVAAWVSSIRGAGLLGLATIVAEAGPLDRYANPQKLWKRLGFAPFDGYAGSSWKRDSWRPRKLTAEEWTENPFSGERYALTHQIVVWLVNAQWIGAAKSDTGEGKPKGPYGETYARRRAHTMQTHPDWSLCHRRMDALRITMKEFLKHLWCEWNNKQRISADQHDFDLQKVDVSRAADQLVVDAQCLGVGRHPLPPDHSVVDAQHEDVRQSGGEPSKGVIPTGLLARRRKNKKTADQFTGDAQTSTVSRAADHVRSDAHIADVGRTNSRSA